MTDAGFVKLRRGLKEHLSNGWMSTAEFVVFTQMLMLADWKTGQLYANATDFATEELSDRRVRRAIEGLISKKYLQCPVSDRKSKTKKRLFSIRNYQGFTEVSGECPVSDRSVTDDCPVSDRSVTGFSSQTIEETDTYVSEEVRSKNKEVKKEEEELILMAKDIKPFQSAFFKTYRKVIPEKFKDWDNLRIIIDADGRQKTLDSLNDWLDKNKDEKYSNPLREFVAYMSSPIVKEEPDNEMFCAELASIAEGKIIFNKFQRLEIQEIRKKHGDADVRQAFEMFYSSVQGDDFALKNASKNFVEGAVQLIYTIKKTRESIAATERLLAQMEAEPPTVVPEPEPINPDDFDPTKW